MNSKPPITPAIGRDDRQRRALAVGVGQRTREDAAEEPAHEEDEHRHERERLRAHPVRRDRAHDRADAHERGARARARERDEHEQRSAIACIRIATNRKSPYAMTNDPRQPHDQTRDYGGTGGRRSSPAIGIAASDAIAVSESIQPRVYAP